MAFTEHESVKSHYQWLSKLDVGHVPEQKNYRRTSIICTIGTSFTESHHICSRYSTPNNPIGPKTNSVQSINNLRKGDFLPRPRLVWNIALNPTKYSWFEHCANELFPRFPRGNSYTQLSQGPLLCVAIYPLQMTSGGGLYPLSVLIRLSHSITNLSSTTPGRPRRSSLVAHWLLLSILYAFPVLDRFYSRL